MINSVMLINYNLSNPQSIKNQRDIEICSFQTFPHFIKIDIFVNSLDCWNKVCIESKNLDISTSRNYLNIFVLMNKIIETRNQF